MPPLPRRTLCLALLAGALVLVLYTYSPETVFKSERLAVEVPQRTPAANANEAPEIKPPTFGLTPPVVPPPPHSPPSTEPKVASDEESTFGTDPILVAPRLTLIALWSPQNDRPSIHIPNFVASAAANPSLSLLLVKFDKYKLDDGQCEKRLVQGDGYTNVREVCVSLDE